MDDRAGEELYEVKLLRERQKAVESRYHLRVEREHETYQEIKETALQMFVQIFRKKMKIKSP